MTSESTKKSASHRKRSVTLCRAVIVLFLLVLGAWIFFTLSVLGAFRPIPSNGVLYTKSHRHLLYNKCKQFHSDDYPFLLGSEDLEYDSISQCLFVSSDSRIAYTHPPKDPKSVPSGHISAICSSPESKIVSLTQQMNLNFEFHPHGMNLYRSQDGKLYIFVINHIVPHGETYVELFKVNGANSQSRVEDLTLEHIRRFPVHKNANDVAALDMEHILVTIDHYYDRNTIPNLIESFFLLPFSSVQLVDSSGQSSNVVSNQIFPNGVFVHNGYVFISETTAQKISVYRLHHRLHQYALDFVTSISIPTGVDNLFISDDKIYVAGHPKMYQVFAHARNHSLPSASDVWTVDIEFEPEFRFISNPNILLEDSGIFISASSVAVPCFDSFLALGTVFDTVYFCSLD